MNSKGMLLAGEKFDKKYKRKYEFDVRKDSLNYYATVRSKVDKDGVNINA